MCAALIRSPQALSIKQVCRCHIYAPATVYVMCLFCQLSRVLNISASNILMVFLYCVAIGAAASFSQQIRRCLPDFKTLLSASLRTVKIFIYRKVFIGLDLFLSTFFFFVLHKREETLSYLPGLGSQCSS